MSRSDEPELTEPTGAPSADGGGADDGAAGDRSRRRVALISVAAVVVLAVVGVVVYLLTSGDDDPGTADRGRDVPTITDSPVPSTKTPTSTPASAAPPATATGAVEGADAAESVAQQAASAISSADITALTALSCDPSSVGTEETFPSDAKAEVVGEPQITGDTATVDIKLTLAGAEPTTVPMPLTLKDGRWCVP